MPSLSALLESLLHGFVPSTVTEVFLWLLVGFWVFSAHWLRQGKHPTLTAHAPTLLASLGILGTFVGIVVGLLDFDPGQLDQSIEGLLEGLKTAFVSSIAGITASFAFRIAEPFLKAKAAGETEPAVGPEDVVAVLTEQKELLQATRDAIAGEEESSLAGQLKLLRSDLSDRRREDTKFREQFEAELWKRLQDFAEMMSKSATEQVIKALKSVIVDFNQNLTEQFGDNFKKLDESVQKLVEWQEGYRRQLEQLHGLYDQSVQQITAIEASVARIAEHTKSIPESAEKIADIVKTANREIDELERHLAAFAELRDRAVEAVPQTQAHVEKTVQDIAAAARLAGEHLTTLQKDSNEQLAQSRKVLERLAQAGQKMEADIQAVQDRVASTIMQMQSRLDGALDEAFKRTGEGLNEQLKAFDEALAREMNRAMQQMANALGQIAGKFVDDYTKLVNEMGRIVRAGNNR